jgi:hypothetical protein
MNTNMRLYAVGVNLPDLGTIIVTEQDGFGALSWPEFLTGINAAIAGADLAEMQTADSVAGYWYARKCQGSKHNEHDGAIEDDNEWNSRGMW